MSRRGRPTRLEQVQRDGLLAEDSTEANYHLRKHRFRLRVGRNEYVCYWWYDATADGSGQLPAYEAAKEAYLDAWVAQIMGNAPAEEEAPRAKRAAKAEVVEEVEGSEEESA